MHFRQIHTRYNADNIIQELYQEWYNDTWIDYWKSNFKYENKNLVEEVYQKRFKNLENYVRYSHKYDSSNQPIEEIYQDWHNGNWNNKEKIEYKYNEMKNVTELILKKWYYSKWNCEGRKLSYYNLYNRPNFIIFQCNIDSAWVNVSTYEYNYDKNTLITRLLKKWNNFIWENNWRCIIMILTIRWKELLKFGADQVGIISGTAEKLLINLN